MKLAVLGFLAISASAMSSDAAQHGKDNKRALRDLKEKKGPQKKSKSAKVDMASVSPPSLDSTDPSPSDEEIAAVEVVSAKAVDVIPACPPAYYVAKTDYVGGDLVTITDNIFACNSPYVMYCNIGEWDDALLDQDENAGEMWSDAWVYVGPCTALTVVVPEPTSLPTLSPTLAPSIEVEATSALAVVVPEPTSLPTFSPTLAPSIEVEATQAIDVVPACPTAYDITKTDYLGGDKVTITENIFECHSLYVMYCNIGEWDESLLAQDENAEEMWSDAWVYVGPCA